MPYQLPGQQDHADAIGSEFIGREPDEETLLHMLLNPTAKEVLLPIVAIVGIGGEFNVCLIFQSGGGRQQLRTEKGRFMKKFKDM